MLVISSRYMVAIFRVKELVWRFVTHGIARGRKFIWNTTVRFSQTSILYLTFRIHAMCKFTKSEHICHGKSLLPFQFTNCEPNLFHRSLFIQKFSPPFKSTFDDVFIVNSRSVQAPKSFRKAVERRLGYQRFCIVVKIGFQILVYCICIWFWCSLQSHSLAMTARGKSKEPDNQLGWSGFQPNYALIQGLRWSVRPVQKF